MATQQPQYLVETDWLAKNLDQKDLRIIDCHYFLEFGPSGPPTLVSGKKAWETSHIPNSIFIDLQTDVSDKNTKLPFMMPPIQEFKDFLANKGIGEGSRVVIYDRGESSWAARMWWMLRYSGFANASVLNGGWKKWQAEKRAESNKIVSFPKTQPFKGTPKPAMFTDKNAVLASLNEKNIKRICCLGKPNYDKGHIPASQNIPAGGMVDPKTNAFLSAKELETVFTQAGLKKDDQIIAYCGGAISASCGAFAMTMAGYKNVTLYDGSMDEWKLDASLPMEKA